MRDSRLLWVRMEYISNLLQLKQKQDAINELLKLTRDAPQNSWAYRQLHQLYLQENQTLKAKELESQVRMKLGEDQPLVLELQAAAAFLKKNYSDALIIYESLLQRMPKNQNIIQNLAMVHFHLGNLEDSRKLLKQGFSMRSLDTKYWLYWGATLTDDTKKNWIDDEQQNLLRTFLNEVPFFERNEKVSHLKLKKTAWYEVLLGLQAQKKRDLKTAEKYYQSVNAKLPSQALNKSIILANLGMIADQNEQKLKAMQYYQTANLHHDLWLMQRFATLLGENGQFQESIAIFKKLLKQNPKNPSLLNNTAWFQLIRPDASTQTRQEAMELATQAVELVPSPEYIDTLAEAYFQLGQKQKAHELIARAKSQSLRDPEQYFYMLRQSYRFLKPEQSMPPIDPTYQKFKQHVSKPQS